MLNNNQNTTRPTLERGFSISSEIIAYNEDHYYTHCIVDRESQPLLQHPSNYPSNSRLERNGYSHRNAAYFEDYQTANLLSPTASCSKNHETSNWQSAKSFVKSQTFILSTHSGVEPESIEFASKCSNMQTLMNIIKGTTGPGILSLPIAFKNGGLWTGLIVFLLLSCVVVHCMHMLTKVAARLENRSGMYIRTYADAAEISFLFGPKQLQKFSNFFKYFVNCSVIFVQLSFCCVYIVFISTNIKHLGDQFWLDSPDIRVYEVFVYISLLPYIMIRNLKTLAVFSAIANVLFATGLIIIFQYLCQKIPDSSNRAAFSSWEELPLFFGLSVFAFESICLMIPLRNKMEKPEEWGGWSGVLNLGMVLICVLYTAVGFYGYLKFGEKVAGTVTLNLPEGNWLYVSVDLMFAVVVYFGLAVQFYVPINVIWPILEKKITNENRVSLYFCLTRMTLLFFVLVIALVVPHVDLLITLIGSFFGSFLALVLPSTLDLVNSYQDKTLSSLKVIKDILIMLIGIVGFASGTYSSLLQIAYSF